MKTSSFPWHIVPVSAMDQTLIVNTGISSELHNWCIPKIVTDSSIMAQLVLIKIRTFSWNMFGMLKRLLKILKKFILKGYFRDVYDLICALSKCNEGKKDFKTAHLYFI